MYVDQALFFLVLMTAVAQSTSDLRITNLIVITPDQCRELPGARVVVMNFIFIAGRTSALCGFVLLG